MRPDGDDGRAHNPALRIDPWRRAGGRPRSRRQVRPAGLHPPLRGSALPKAELGSTMRPHGRRAPRARRAPTSERPRGIPASQRRAGAGTRPGRPHARCWSGSLGGSHIPGDSIRYSRQGIRCIASTAQVEQVARAGSIDGQEGVALRKRPLRAFPGDRSRDSH